MDNLENENNKNENVNSLEEFCSGDRKTLNVIMSREDMDKCTLLHFIDADTGVELFSQWRRKEDIFGDKKIPQGERIGRREPYALLFYKNIKKVLEGEEFVGNVDCQLATLMKLTEFVQMGTGRLINKRSKKPLTREGIAKVLGLSVRRTATILSNLKKNGFIERIGGSYVVNRRYIARGKEVKVCDTTSQMGK